MTPLARWRLLVAAWRGDFDPEDPEDALAAIESIVTDWDNGKIPPGAVLPAIRGVLNAYHGQPS